MFDRPWLFLGVQCRHKQRENHFTSIRRVYIIWYFNSSWEKIVGSTKYIVKICVFWTDSRRPGTGHEKKQNCMWVSVDTCRHVRTVLEYKAKYGQCLPITIYYNKSSARQMVYWYSLDLVRLKGSSVIKHKWKNNSVIGVVLGEVLKNVRTFGTK